MRKLLATSSGVGVAALLACSSFTASDDSKSSSGADGGTATNEAGVSQGTDGNVLPLGPCTPPTALFCTDFDETDGGWETFPTPTNGKVELSIARSTVNHTSLRAQLNSGGPGDQAFIGRSFPAWKHLRISFDAFVETTTWEGGDVGAVSIFGLSYFDANSNEKAEVEFIWTNTERFLGLTLHNPNGSDEVGRQPAKYQQFQRIVIEVSPNLVAGGRSKMSLTIAQGEELKDQVEDWQLNIVPGRMAIALGLARYGGNTPNVGVNYDNVVVEELPIE